MTAWPALSCRLTGFSPVDLTNLTTIFFTIVIEAVPFMLIGVMVSALLNNFVTEKVIRFILPSNVFSGMLAACFVGLVFPICECGIVPVARRLITKGVPLPVAVAFMLATPVINPVVATATVAAFNGTYHMMYLRLGMALLVAVITGIITCRFFPGTELKKQCKASHRDCRRHNYGSATFRRKIVLTLKDAGSEFWEMGQYLLFGAFLSAAAQVLVDRSLLLSVGHRPWLSILAMMFFAFGLSVCSTADSFIAASLGTVFSPASQLAFMVFGPMLDLKNTFMLVHAFRFRFVFFLMVTVTLLCAGGAYLVNIWPGNTL